MDIPWISPLKIICGNCLRESTHVSLSAKSFGFYNSCELDTRPLAIYDVILIGAKLVQECPFCKYCYSDIQNISKLGEVTLLNPAYHSQITNKDCSTLTNQFLCKALIEEAEGNIIAAAWSNILAAWCCDDSGNHFQAKQCRLKAVELLQLGRNIGLTVFEKEGEFVSLLVDLNRRSDNLRISKQLAEHRFKIETESLFKKLLFFQINLCDRQDIARHSIEDAVHYYDKNQIADLDTLQFNSNNFYADSKTDHDRDYFDAMTDGQLGDYDDFKEGGGNIDDL